LGLLNRRLLKGILEATPDRGGEKKGAVQTNLTDILTRVVVMGSSLCQKSLCHGDTLY
jgi:hypothetical protein